MRILFTYSDETNLKADINGQPSFLHDPELGEREVDEPIVPSWLLNQRKVLAGQTFDKDCYIIPIERMTKEEVRRARVKDQASRFEAMDIPSVGLSTNHL